MSHKPKDPLDAFIESLFTAAFHIVWGIVALIIAAVVKIVQTPPEKQLQSQNRVGNTQNLICPTCNTQNNQNARQCLLCGTRLKRAPDTQWADDASCLGLFIMAGLVCTAVIVVIFIISINIQ